MSLQFRLLRGFSLLVFLGAIVLHICSAAMDVAQRVNVRDKAGVVVGTATIPIDGESFKLYTFCFMVLAGLLFWTTRVVTQPAKTDSKDESP